MKVLAVIGTFIAVSFPQEVAAQSATPAYQTYPFIQSFSRKDYSASTQNWDIVQDKRGVMYFGNGQGVLEYNGKQWRLIELANKSTARSLAQQGDSTIFVGGIDDIGYLAPDSLGVLQYVSLVSHIPEEDRSFGEVWFTHAVQGAIYFQSLTHLFRWADGTIDVWRPPTRFNTSGAVHDQLYVHSTGEGLHKMVNDSLVLMPESEPFKDEWFVVMLPWDDETLLLGTIANGLYLLKNGSFEPFITEVDDYLRSSLLYLPGAILHDDTIALNTRNYGLLILDRAGRLLHRFDEEKGLNTNQAFFVFQDREQGLWVTTGSGMARIDYPSPLSFVNTPDGIPPGPLALGILDQVVYVGSQEGLFTVDKYGAFNPVKGAALRVWHIASTPDAIYAATDDGVIHIADGETIFWNVAQEVGTDFYTGFSIHRSTLDPTIVFLGRRNGLDVLTHSLDDPNSWSLLGVVPGITNQINNITEPRPGHLVLTMENGVIHMNYDSSSLLNPELKYWDDAHGLPVGSTGGYIAAGTQFYTTTDGLFVFDEQSDTFERVDSLFPGISTADFSAYGSIKEGNDGELWISSRDGMHRAIPGPNGYYDIESAPFLQASDWTLIDSQIDSAGVVWLGGVDGLVRYDPATQKPYDISNPPLISRITIGVDSLVAGGAGAPLADLYPSALSIKHRENTIRFDFQSAQLDLPFRIRHQSKLDGYDTDWSAYSTDFSRTYTNLPGGSYTFYVRAQNAYGVESEPATFSFTVHPPWWYTWWAYAGYVLLFGLSIFGATRINRRRLIARERLRAEREKAKAIESTNNELQKALTHLTQAQSQLVHAEKMASLGQLTAGIAHELKNPLNFVNNFGHVAKEQAEDIKALLSETEKHGNGSSDELQTIIHALTVTTQKITEHGQRADGIIQTMLDHSRLGERYKEAIDVHQLIDEFARHAYHGFQARISDLNVDIQYDYDQDLPPIELYTQEIGRVIINLLDNAFYSVQQKQQQSPGDYQPVVRIETKKRLQFAEIRISDNGVGISNDVFQKIFDPFFTTKPTGSGTGLGLSLSYDIIVQGHNGSLKAEPHGDEGVTFIITLPLTRG